ncbi:MAG TPA: tRNA (adenosine(37)-N6)-threonylcarbamoyltransferase complex ATPase subunit type 1 TsaE [Verrucomicrobiales bacterium]|nr:tRNA (adenosine(37)-N6)-threonylcarbamoyltransferase complex ATPase subunit type 1 TsaE [Verrucomicrobiales bacterium]
MVTLISRSPEETRALGERWGRFAQRGWVIGLRGDLGAGKTQFVKGLAAGLGITTRVHSPTFGIVNEYEGGRLPLFHLDLYRLESAEQIVSAGLEGYLVQPDGVSVVEWIDHWLPPGQPAPEQTDNFHLIKFEILGEQERSLTHDDPGN